MWAWRDPQRSISRDAIVVVFGRVKNDETSKGTNPGRECISLHFEISSEIHNDSLVLAFE
jgi:hypothetical protein